MNFATYAIIPSTASSSLRYSGAFMSTIALINTFFSWFQPISSNPVSRRSSPHSFQCSTCFYWVSGLFSLHLSNTCFTLWLWILIVLPWTRMSSADNFYSFSYFKCCQYCSLEHFWWTLCSHGHSQASVSAKWAFECCEVWAFFTQLNLEEPHVRIKCTGTICFHVVSSQSHQCCSWDNILLKLLCSD